MSLCGITHEAPGSHHTPATRAQMAAKQANYFNTKLWCPAQTLQGHFGILHVSLGITEENMCHRGMKTSGRFSLSSAGPVQYLVSRREGAHISYLLGKQRIWETVCTVHWLKKKKKGFPVCFVRVCGDQWWKIQIECFWQNVTIIISMCC